jgi:hypothetical protein
MRAMKVNARASLPAAAAVLAFAGTVSAKADPAPFDLAGPNLEVKVTRGAQTLPIAEVPNLAAGDHLWIRADLPTTQSARYLLVAAFLRGATNPPPKSWFYQCETWSRPCAQEGLSIEVPAEAQQVLLFLAPQTGGDFKALLGAVRGRPGAFVRASQDLNQATLDRSRLDAHLAAIRALGASDPAKLKEVAPLLARSLAIRVDEKCFDRIPELQAPCLMQGQNALILNDGHSTSIVEALTSGPASDLAMEASYTPQLSYGYYSPYIASVLDIARILDSFHTAHYQYIPALATLEGDQLALSLNAPPSFRDPQSVLVVALPAVERAQVPPLHAVDPKEIYCARKDVLVLPVEGAPLVFSTGYAHEVTLSLSGKDGKSIDLPARADPQQGGFVVETSGLGTASLGDRVQGSLHGFWGFERYSGPVFELVNAHAQNWALADDGALIVGREDTVHLQAGSVSCVERVMIQDADGKELKTDWKTVRPNEVEVKLPLQGAMPGPITLLVTQHGGGQPQHVSLHAFSEAAHLEHFTLYSGEDHGVLQGSRLDEVASLSLKDVVFLPGKLTTSQGRDELAMLAQDAPAALALRQGDVGKARVVLKDGRGLVLAVAVEAPRPDATLMAKSVLPSASSSASNIELGDPDELPQDAQLTFSLKSQSPTGFAHDEKVEVATPDGSSTATLSMSNGRLMLEDSRVAVATLDPSRVFGPSTFGPLQFRVVAGGVAGDWHPLATLVRLPLLRELKCPATAELACKLSGSNLFLVEAISNDPKFAHPVQVPDGFPGYALPVPHPTAGSLYVKLRDYPSVINETALMAQSLAPSPDEVTRAESRHEAHTGTTSAPESPAPQYTPAVPATPDNPPTRAPSPGSTAAPAPAPTSTPAGVTALVPATPDPKAPTPN